MFHRSLLTILLALCAAGAEATPLVVTEQSRSVQASARFEQSEGGSVKRVTSGSAMARGTPLADQDESRLSAVDTGPFDGSVDAIVGEEAPSWFAAAHASQTSTLMPFSIVAVGHASAEAQVQAYEPPTDSGSSEAAGLSDFFIEFELENPADFAVSAVLAFSESLDGGDAGGSIHGSGAAGLMLQNALTDEVLLELSTAGDVAETLSLPIGSYRLFAFAEATAGVTREEPPLGTARGDAFAEFSLELRAIPEPSSGLLLAWGMVASAFATRTLRPWIS